MWENHKDMKYTYIPKGTCSRQIDIEVVDGRIADVSFTGGCNGNLKGIAAMVKGLTPQEVIERLEGIECGNKGTSCPDQFAKALRNIS